MSAPNIINLSGMYGKTALLSPVPTGTLTTFIPLVSGNHVYKLNSLVATNISSGNVGITTAVTRNAVDYYTAYRITVPSNASIILVGKDSNLYLEENDTLKATADITGAISLYASYEDIL